MMLIKFKNLNRWIKISIGLFAVAIVCMIIGLGCLGTKIGSVTYYDIDRILKIGDVLKHSASYYDYKGADAAAFNTWKAGAAFAVILTPIFAGLSLTAVGYDFNKEKNNRF